MPPAHDAQGPARGIHERCMKGAGHWQEPALDLPRLGPFEHALDRFARPRDDGLARAVEVDDKDSGLLTD